MSKRVDLAAAAAQRRAAMEKEQEEKGRKLMEKERERMARAEAVRLQTINKKATMAKSTTPVRDRVSQRRTEAELSREMKAKLVLETEKDDIAKAEAKKKEAMRQTSLAAKKSNHMNEVLEKKSAIDQQTTRHLEDVHKEEERREELAQVQRRESLLSRVNTAQTTTHTDVVQRNKERQAQAAKTRAAQEQARLEQANARRQEMLAERAAKASQSPHVVITSRPTTPAKSPGAEVSLIEFASELPSPAPTLPPPMQALYDAQPIQNSPCQPSAPWTAETSSPARPMAAPEGNYQAMPAFSSPVADSLPMAAQHAFFQPTTPQQQHQGPTYSTGAAAKWPTDSPQASTPNKNQAFTPQPYYSPAAHDGHA